MRKNKNKKPKIIAMIPARMGSTRLKMKNLALLGSKPLIYYAISAAKKTSIFDKIVLNSENPIFGRIAKRYGIEFYKRPTILASSNTKSDSVVYDFVKNNPCDVIVWVNPIAPLQTAREIMDIVKYFRRKKLDSLITVKNEQVHCLYKGKPINFKNDEIFAKTQDLAPVKPFVYSIMMWRRNIFMRDFEKKGYAFFCGRVGFYPVSMLSTIIIKKKSDLMLAEFLLKTCVKETAYKIKYDRVLKYFMEKNKRG